MLPRLSKVHQETTDNYESIYFFVEVRRTIQYAVVTRWDQLWWITSLGPDILDEK